MKQIMKFKVKQNVNIKATIKGESLFARPGVKALGRAPRLGETFELLLIRGRALVFCSCPGKRSGAQTTWQQELALDEACGARIEEYIREPDSDFLAVGLQESNRVLLIAPVPGLADGEAIGLLVHIGAASVCRVLNHSFASVVRIDPSAHFACKGNIRTTDEVTYRFLARLVYDCRRLLGGAPIEVKDRRELSLRMQDAIALLLRFLGVESMPELPTFPLAYPFVGQWSAARTAWMLLLVYAALHRRYGKDWPEHVKAEPDNEYLLPMLSFQAGNRARLPEELTMCVALAERYDMFFDVRKRKNRVLVRLCPLVMSTERLPGHPSYEPGPSRYQLHATHPFWDLGPLNKE